MLTDKAELATRIRHVRINGCGQPTPVADDATLTEIAWMCPGKKSKKRLRQVCKEESDTNPSNTSPSDTNLNGISDSKRQRYADRGRINGVQDVKPLLPRDDPRGTSAGSCREATLRVYFMLPGPKLHRPSDLSRQSRHEAAQVPSTVTLVKFGSTEDRAGRIGAAWGTNVLLD